MLAGPYGALEDSSPHALKAAQLRVRPSLPAHYAGQASRNEVNARWSLLQAMDRIHAILPDGTVVTDVEVFRRLYEAVGLGWVYAVTKYEPAMKAANWWVPGIMTMEHCFDYGGWEAGCSIEEIKGSLAAGRLGIWTV
jgi:hypothetical protein